MRRQQQTLALQQQIKQIARRKLNKIHDLAGLIAPHHISVHNFSSRLAVLRHYFKVLQSSIGDAKNYVYKKLPAFWQKWRRRAALPELDSHHAGAQADARIKEPGVSWYKSFFTKSYTLGQAGLVYLKQPDFLGYFRRSFKKIKISIKNIKTSPYGAGGVNNITPSVKGGVSGSGSGYDQSPPKPAPILHVVHKNINNLASPRPSIRGGMVSREKPPAAKQSAGTVRQKKMMAKLFKKEIQSTSPISQAKLALKESHVNKAEELLVPYLAKHPRDTQAYMLLGKAAVRRAAWREAVEIYEQVLRIDPAFSPCYGPLGQASYECGNLTKAIEFLQRAHDSDPDNVQVIQQLYKIACRMDNLPMQRSLTNELQKLKAKEAIPNRAAP